MSKKTESKLKKATQEILTLWDQKQASMLQGCLHINNGPEQDNRAYAAFTRYSRLDRVFKIKVCDYLDMPITGTDFNIIGNDIYLLSDNTPGFDRKLANFLNRSKYK